jgi:1-acyl-sn-glycerol-3-phosphate acyltransferase
LTTFALKSWHKLLAALHMRVSLRSIESFYRYWFTRFALRVFKPHYYGFENIPDSGPVIIASNHVSYVDGLIIAAGCPNRAIRYIIDDHIYRLPIVHYFMKLNRAIPILPKRESVAKALDQISEGLKAGDAICIFPEGQLTFTGSLGRFRPGIEYMLRRDQVPVVPIAINGLWGSMFSRKRAKSRWWFIPKPGKRDIVAICGAPIPAEEVTVNSLQQAVLRLKYSHPYMEH